MKAKTSELKAALYLVTPPTKKHTTIPILSCLKLQAAGEKLAITSTNLDVFAAVTCPCTGELPEVCVDAEMLSCLVSGAGEFVEIERGPHDLLVVRSRGTAQLHIQPPEQFPTWPDESHSVALGIDPDELADCVKAVSWASDELEYVGENWKECVWVKTDGKAIQCCATDSKEFAYMTHNAALVQSDFMFPAKQAALLINSLETGTDAVKVSPSFISTCADRFRVAVKLAEGKFIPVHYLLDQQQKPLGNLPLPQILEALHTIKTLGKQDEYISCKMVFEQNKITVSYRSKYAHFEQEIVHALNGEDCVIWVDALKAIRVFSHVPPSGTASLGDASILFTDGEYTYALARLQGDE